MVNDFSVDSHLLVPKHEVISDEEKEKLMKRYSIKPEDLPKILITDPAIRSLKVKSGDIIKITRRSPTAGASYFYRLVIDD